MNFSEDLIMPDIDVDSYRKSIKYLNIGDAYIQIQNLNNKKIRVQKISFEISPEGKISIQPVGYETVNTLDELKNMVKLYRLAYKEIKMIEKKLKIQGDF
jgi:hypothetical protein